MDVGDDHPPASPPLESREPTRQDLPDLHFLRLLFEQSGEQPPE
jgi:hypothetical protein